MKFVRRKATTSRSKHKPENFAKLKEAFLDDVLAVVTMEEVHPELILNWDQTGIHLVPASAWTSHVPVRWKLKLRMAALSLALIYYLDGQKITSESAAENCCYLTFIVYSSYFYSRCAQLLHHSPKHWSTEETMVQYINEIIVSYVECQRGTLGDKPALVIIDNFKGQTTSTINRILEAHDIHVCLLPPNTTDLLQYMDVAVNKPAKDFLKRKFEAWYSDEVTKQLQGKDVESVELEPINLCFPAVKELSAKWLVEMADYISDNPQFIVNGFRRAGISEALDGYRFEEDSEEHLSDTSDYVEGFFSSDSD